MIAPPPDPLPPGGGQRGFVLVLTLWVLVIVAIAAGYFSESVTRAVGLAQQSKQNTRAAIDMAGTRAEILYRLGTTSLTEYGIGRGNTAISLDNRVYHALGDTLVQLQDNRGLFNLNHPDEAMLNRFLGLLGVAAEQRSRLIDTLNDYTDSDSLYRLNGAEEKEYLAQGLPPPSNSKLITPWEARRIIGWRTSPQLWENDKLAELTTTGTSLGVNPNTAPAEILATLPGVTEEIAKNIIALRKIAPIINEGPIVAQTGIPINQLFGMAIIALPSEAIRVTQSTRGLPGAVQYNVTLTPNGKETPWRIEYYSRVGVKLRDETPPAELPPRSTASPDQSAVFLSGG